jgi:hypothetical protein
LSIFDTFYISISSVNRGKKEEKEGGGEKSEGWRE